jgi:hypothetical protein
MRIAMKHILFLLLFFQTSFCHADDITNIINTIDTVREKSNMNLNPNVFPEII